MYDHVHRVAVASLALAAFAALAALSWPHQGGPALTAQPQWIQILVAIVLMTAVFQASLRIPVVGGVVLVKAASAGAVSTQMLAALPSGVLVLETLEGMFLIVALAIFVHEHRREARWNGVLPLRPEAW